MLSLSKGKLDWLRKRVFYTNRWSNCVTFDISKIFNENTCSFCDYFCNISNYINNTEAKLENEAPMEEDQKELVDNSVRRRERIQDDAKD